jgi:3-oxoacyl-[acyl-carrier-protein] synthase II
MSRQSIPDSERIVITGVGMVGPGGLDTESNWQTLTAEEPVAVTSDVRDTVFVQYPQLRTTIAGPVRDFNILDNPAFARLDEQDLKRTIHRSAQFSLWAAAEALQQANVLTDDYRINPDEVNPDLMGIRIGTGIGGAPVIGDAQSTIERKMKIIEDREGKNPPALALDENNQIIYEDGKRIRPWSILQVLPDRVATVPAKYFGIKGPPAAVISACATGNANIIDAARLLKLGEAEGVLAGGVEAATDAISIGMFEGTGAVDQATDPSVASLPFHMGDALNKNIGKGMSMSEGGALVYMETLERARARGAIPLMELLGYAESGDAFHDTSPSGEGAVRAIKLALARARAEFLHKVFLAHATGTGGDEVEIDTIGQIVSPEEEVDVFALKGWFGHLLGGAGSAAAVVAKKIIETGILPASKTGEYPLPTPPNFNMGFGKPTRIEGDFVVIENSFGFGGMNAVLALAKVI